MKVSVDFDSCASTGSCMQVCPEVFEVRNDGYLYISIGDEGSHNNAYDNAGNPLFPALWSGPTAGSVAARQKQFPRSLSDFEPAPQFDSLNSWPRALFP